MELIVKNVMQCTCCGGTVDRHTTQEAEDEMQYYVEHRDTVTRPMPEGYFECRDCGAMGDLFTGIMTPMREKSI